jgi:type I restriction enzyme S subunit
MTVLGPPKPGWRSSQIRFLASMASGEGITSEDIEPSGTYPVYGGNGLRGYTDNFTHEGDYVLIGRQGALCGNVHFVNGRFWASEHAVVACPTKGIEARCLAYLLGALNLGQYSISAAQPGLAMDRIKELVVAVPETTTQAAIANFLDRKTATIDELIRRKERLIELLQEERQALITQAVTKGLDPNVPMKDSGIEWIGKIPRHWRVSRGRFLFRQLSLSPREEDRVVTAFRNGQVTLRENRRVDGFTLAEKEIGYQHVRVGDLVLHSMDAFAGAIGISESDGKCTPEYVVLEPRSPTICGVYYAHCLRWMAKQNFIFVICPSVRERAPRFRYETFKDVLLPLPPVEEQKKICDFIGGLPERHKAVAVELGRHIDLLHEYRQALITAAVTGQLDIPAEAA